MTSKTNANIGKLRRVMRRAFLMVAVLTSAPLATAQTEQVTYYHVDAVGSVRMTTDSTGQVIARYDYLPFGGDWPDPPSGQESRRFAAKEHDQVTGFEYFGARYYAGQTGRFTTVDPISVTEARLLNPQRLNRYTYAVNNPLRYVDPKGLDVITYDEYGDETERQKQSKWHNFWFGDSYRISTASGTFNLAEGLKPLSGGEKYQVVGSAETSQLLNTFLAAQSPSSPGQSLSYFEIIRRATDANQWNWKVPLNLAFPRGIFMLDGLGQRSDYLGNYAFGYLMNAWGSSTFAAKWGGAAFNLYDSVGSGANPFKGSLFTGYDDPRDFAAINAGAALYGRTR